MTAPVWLIAGREFRAYAATVSFWIALAIGPLVLGGAALLAAARPEPAPAPATLSLTRGADGVAEARFSENFPLSPAARAQALKLIEDDRGAPVRLAPAPAGPPVDVTAVSRFARVMMLWMTLVGSLGMLLQAVVRERTNRALESLMAAASARDIVLGKLAGVGAVSLLVLGAWLGAAGVTAAVTAPANLVADLIRPLAQPLELLRATAIYALAFGFYGLLTVAVGALARDNADAQNLARPMFAVLLAVFFAAMATATGGATGLDWLVYLPPFAPFMLLLGSHDLVTELTALAGLVLSTAFAAYLAVRALRLNYGETGIRRRWTTSSNTSAPTAI